MYMKRKSVSSIGKDSDLSEAHVVHKHSVLIVRVTKAKPVHQVFQAHPDPLGQEVLLETQERTDPGDPLETK